jgi:hypothetical protein
MGAAKAMDARAMVKMVAVFILIVFDERRTGDFDMMGGLYNIFHKRRDPAIASDGVRVSELTYGTRMAQLYHR